MNTPVSFESAKLLKEKGWDIPTLNFYFEDGESMENTLEETTGMDYGSQFEVQFSELIENWNDRWLTKKDGSRCFGCSKSNGYLETFSAPTIVDVIMWLYEKYGIWLWVSMELGYNITFCWQLTGDGISSNYKANFKTPTEAYSGGIEYILTNIIKNNQK